jgi:ubiquinone/menaquinone biosynthesis C-methylase UbiE
MTAMERPSWQYDEMRQVGTDYANPEEAAKWDDKRATLGDVAADMQRMISLLRPGANDVLIDIGAGTGTFVVEVARVCRKVHAVDVSAAMLDCARRKAEAAGVNGAIEYHQAGFLTYEHGGEGADIITSMAALHHLPDAWKQVGLLRMADMLRPGGRLLLRDVVFSFEPRQWGQAFDGMVSAMGARGGDSLAAAMARHIRQEFSAFDWVMEGMLRRAGFHVDVADYRDGLALYLCTKPVA